MYYSYVEIEYVATSFSPARTDLALKLLKKQPILRKKISNQIFISDSYYPFLLTKIRWPLSVEEAGSEKKNVFFCLCDWGGGRGTGLQSLSSLLPPPLHRSK